MLVLELSALASIDDLVDGVVGRGGHMVEPPDVGGAPKALLLSATKRGKTMLIYVQCHPHPLIFYFYENSLNSIYCTYVYYGTVSTCI